MAKLVITNKFELGMLAETVYKTRGLAMGMYEFDDATKLIKHFHKHGHGIVTEFRRSNDHYRSDHERYFYQKVLHEIFGKISLLMSEHNYSEAFEEGDYLMVVKITHDPIYTDADIELQDTTSIYLLSF